MVLMSVSAPSEMMYKFSKQNMRSKEFTINGVNWETADFICTNSKCRHTTNGYGNYVSNLAKENESLKKKLEIATNALEALNYQENADRLIVESALELLQEQS